MGAKCFQEVGPRLLACHDPNLACHGMSISCVSMSSMSCRVIILRVSMSVPRHGHPVLDLPGNRGGHGLFVGIRDFVSEPPIGQRTRCWPFLGSGGV